MALLYTLTVGSLLWWLGAGTVDTRYTMGIGGPWVYGSVLLFVLVLALRLNRRGRRGPPGGATARPAAPRWPVLRSVAVAVALGLSMIFVVGIVFDDVIHVGDGATSVWWAGAVMACTSLPLALLVASVARRLRRSAPPEADPPGPTATAIDVASALAPLLVPLAAMILLRLFSAGPWWDERLDGPPRAGVLYYCLLPIMLPAAIVVAYGLDRLDGSTGGALARTIASVALAVLMLAVILLPALLALCEAPVRAAGSSHGPLHGFPSGIRYWRPFLQYERDAGAPYGYAITRLPLDHFFRASAAMLLFSAALTSGALMQLGRGARWMTPGRVACLVGLQVFLTIALMPRLGLTGAPVAAVAGLLIMLMLVLQQQRGRRAATPIAVP